MDVLGDGIFAEARNRVYAHRFVARIVVDRLAGGVPADPKKVEGWIRSKFSSDSGEQLRGMVLDAISERGAENVDAAVEDVARLRHLNGFKRDEDGLYIEGRQLKAMLKEAANIRWPKRKWGPSNKGTRSYWAEHVFVVEEHVHVGRTEPDEVNQRFVHTWKGAGIQYEEVVDKAELTFTVLCDDDLDKADWQDLWVTAEQNGLGAARSQGMGRFIVIGWDKAK